MDFLKNMVHSLLRDEIYRRVLETYVEVKRNPKNAR